MALGPGAYDELATEVRRQAQAVGVLVIVIGGNKGTGFAAQLTAELTLAIPTILRDVAQAIEDGDGSA
jgi:hypothetical protein